VMLALNGLYEALRTTVLLVVSTQRSRTPVQVAVTTLEYTVKKRFNLSSVARLITVNASYSA
jgi:hypothetical protein